MSDFADPLTSFVIVLLIGAAAGFLYDRFAGPGWFSRQVSGSTRGITTSVLVGVAGAFIGFHLAAIIVRSSSSAALFIGAAVGAVLVLWGWRVAR